MNRSTLTLIVLSAVLAFGLGRFLGRDATPLTQPAMAQGAAAPAKLNWARVQTDGPGYSAQVYRAKVPGGWLVNLQAYLEGVGPTLTFYPDPEHTWDGSNLD